MSLNQTEQKLLDEAHERASEAKMMITSHEQLCNERYKGIYDTLAEISLGQKVIYNRMWSIAGTVILLLVTILVSLVAYIYTNNAGGVA